MKILVACLLIQAIIFVLKFNYLPPQIPLFYSRPEGEDQLVDWWGIFFIPLMILFFYVLNTYTFSKFFKEDELIKKFILILNFSITIILSLVFLKIILLIA